MYLVHYMPLWCGCEDIEDKVYSEINCEYFLGETKNKSGKARRDII
jgi:hypothetical protein